MNYAPLTVPKEMSAARTHRTFVTLGMRHLCVVNNSNRVVGIITRKDLEHAAAHGSHQDNAPQNDDQSHSGVSTTPQALARQRDEPGRHRYVSSREVQGSSQERSNGQLTNGSHGNKGR
jgi:chloride channel 7